MRQYTLEEKDTQNFLNNFGCGGISGSYDDPNLNLQSGN